MANFLEIFNRLAETYNLTPLVQEIGKGMEYMVRYDCMSSSTMADMQRWEDKHLRQKDFKFVALYMRGSGILGGEISVAVFKTEELASNFCSAVRGVDKRTGIIKMSHPANLTLYKI